MVTEEDFSAKTAPIGVFEAWARVFRKYFSDLWTITTEPTRFFRAMPRTGGVSGPLAFALITHWIGAGLSFLWRTAASGILARSLRDLFEGVDTLLGGVANQRLGENPFLADMRDRFLLWFWGAGSVVIDPFTTLASILFSSVIIYIGAKLLISRRSRGRNRVTLESAIRILCYGMTPAILAGIPLIGPIFGTLLVMIVTIIGVREVYGIGTIRATVVALFPKLLFVGIILVGLFGALLLAIQLFASLF